MTLAFQRTLGRHSRNHDQSSAGSHDFVNADRERRSPESSEEESEEDGGDVQRSWMKRVELPTFEGTDPMGWITKAEKFFDIQNVTEREKMKLVYICMEGGASYWFRFWRKKTRHPTWSMFTAALTRRFGDLNRGSVYEKLAAVRQRGNVDEYIQEFEVLVAQAAGVNEEQLLGYFFAGLQEGLRYLVRPHDPRDLLTAMERAREVEQAGSVSRGNSGTGGKGGVTWGKYSSSSGTVARTETYRDASEGSVNVGGVGGGSGTKKEGVSSNVTARAGSSGGGNTQGRGVRMLPYPEYIKRREEGRCFQCGGPYSPGHRCAERSMRVMILAEEGEEEGVEEKIEMVEMEEPVMEHTVMELSGLSAGGQTQSNTMKMQGWMKGRRILVLVNSGASHSFISTRLVKELGLESIDTYPYKVCLGDGQKKITSGYCTGVTVKLDELEVRDKLYLFELSGVDVILGITWLASLGEIKVDWGHLIMKVEVEGKVVEIKGDPTLTRRMVTPEVLLKEKEIEAMTLVWSLSQAEAVEGDGKTGRWTLTQEAGLKQILSDFEGVFREPQGLPPERKVDRRIPLKEGTEPISVRPYRYPHLMKTEIERQVEEMLKLGVIRPSNSPYSSPLILMKKKDGSSRFCVDYRALNRVTVADKYPIPIIEELLDELQGARYFSKVDLRAGYHQIRMKNEDIPKTAFRTHQGHYEFLVMPFGLTNAPATFQDMMNSVLRPFLRRCVLVFFDDILIYNKSWDEHMQHLQQVLEVLAQQKLFANRNKCEFGREQIRYLGHKISKAGVEMDEEKVSAVTAWPEPKSIRELRGFLGLTGYYRRFIRGYGKITQPLTNLLKKGKFDWSLAGAEAMQRLKTAVTTAPVLALPDFSQTF
ncbi:uncharacterized protein LOC108324610 [Vigna angularis]|uniref:uncharacterized protein LOC108324610 n=1 Tax=Phaseolus angularis TaxID=3914 RepID=UPI0022B45BAC|nr:uncharacterized protein LOC108324610 [Vigna angularis]